MRNTALVKKLGSSFSIFRGNIGVASIDDTTIIPRAYDSMPVHGVVKWYDPAKGFGFMKPDTSLADIIRTDVLIHKSVLEAFGYQDADEFADITGHVAKTAKGWQMTEIVTLTPPALEVLIHTVNIAEIAEVARVKWFDADRGYGFVQREGDDDDIFLHAVLVQQAGLSTLEPEQVLHVVIGSGPKGKQVKLIQTEK